MFNLKGRVEVGSRHPAIRHDTDTPHNFGARYSLTADVSPYGSLWDTYQDAESFLGLSRRFKIIIQGHASTKILFGFLCQDRKSKLSLDHIGLFSYASWMTTLRDTRKLAGLSQAELASRAHSTQAAIQKLETGARKLTREWAERLAPHLNVSPQALLFSDTESPKAPIVGYVGAGMQVIGERDSDPEYVEVPIAAGEAVEVVVVRGDSMYPVYRDGDRLIFDHISRPLNELIGKECVVQLSDGRTLVKTLRMSGGELVLESFNAPLITDIVVEAAWPVKWIERR